MISYWVVTYIIAVIQLFSVRLLAYAIEFLSFEYCNLFEHSVNKVYDDMNFLNMFNHMYTRLKINPRHHSANGATIRYKTNAVIK